MGYNYHPAAIVRRKPAQVTENGVYVIKAERPELDNPDACLIVVRLNGKFYTVELSAEVTVDKFHPSVTLLGPLK